MLEGAAILDLVDLEPVVGGIDRVKSGPAVVHRQRAHLAALEGGEGGRGVCGLNGAAYGEERDERADAQIASFHRSHSTEAPPPPTSADRCLL
ncbi:hypothetical protein [Nannocystis pusilla]|uniref:hypothetical protein n=1 Tax=Nannocystis pusilla TaxID=889268 RepID=UPI003B776651